MKMQCTKMQCHIATLLTKAGKLPCPKLAPQKKLKLKLNCLQNCAWHVTCVVTRLPFYLNRSVWRKKFDAIQIIRTSNKLPKKCFSFFHGYITNTCIYHHCVLTVQLSSKVTSTHVHIWNVPLTHPRCILDASQMHSGFASNVFWTHCASGKKWHGSY